MTWLTITVETIWLCYVVWHRHNPKDLFSSPTGCQIGEGRMEVDRKERRAVTFNSGQLYARCFPHTTALIMVQQCKMAPCQTSETVWSRWIASELTRNKSRRDALMKIFPWPSISMLNLCRATVETPWSNQTKVIICRCSMSNSDMHRDSIRRFSQIPFTRDCGVAHDASISP